MGCKLNETFFLTGARGLRLRLCEWGTGDDVTVILHGFLEQGLAWDRVAQRLPGRVIAPDQRGHGKSEHVGPGGFYHFFDYVADLDALIRDLGRPVHLIGHSMGGSVACYFAGARPEQVRSLVLVEGLGPPDRRDDPVGTARKHLNDRAALRQHPVFPDINAAISRMRVFNKRLTDEVAHQLVQTLVRPSQGNQLTWAWDHLHRSRNAHPFDAEVFKQFLREITCPTLLIRGSHSKFYPDDYPSRQACLQQATEVVIDDAGHLVHHDQPEALAKAINTFLRGK